MAGGCGGDARPGLPLALRPQHRKCPTRLLPRHAEGSRHSCRAHRHRAHRLASLHVQPLRRWPPAGRSCPWHQRFADQALPCLRRDPEARRKRHPGRLAPGAPVGERPPHLFRDEAVAADRQGCAVQRRQGVAGRLARGQRQAPQGRTAREGCFWCAAAGKGRPLRRGHRRRAAQPRPGNARLGFRSRQRGRGYRLGKRAGSHCHRRGQRRHAAHFLHLAVSHDAGAHVVQ